MAIDLQHERILSLTDASKALPKIDGKHLHTSTLWRWCRRGIRGIQLDYVRLGHRVCTSVEALNRFSQRLAEADSQHFHSNPVVDDAPVTSKQREKSIAQAEAILESGGIL